MRTRTREDGKAEITARVQMKRRREESSIKSSSRDKISMDVRQVALGAVFGAAVAVNAALQSLQDAGSFLTQRPYGKATSSPLPSVSVSVTPPPRKRALIRAAADVDREQASVFRAFLNDEDDDGTALYGAGDSEEQHLAPFSATTPTMDTSPGFSQEELTACNTNSRTVGHGPKKLQVKRKNTEASFGYGYRAEGYLKGSDEENSSTEDGDRWWDNSSSSMNIQSTRRKVRGPLFMPLMPQVVESEEALSAMLQHTTNNVLETLSVAKERREQMLEELKSLNLPEEHTSVQLVSGFIDALINVSESLKNVHSALFAEKDDPKRT